MKILLIDETRGRRRNQSMGVCVLQVDATKYAKLTTAYSSRLKKEDWNEDMEFKGSTIFSSSKGDLKIDIPTRIAIVDDILAELNKGKNSPFVMTVRHNDNGDSTENFTFLLNEALLATIKRMPRANKRSGKHLVSVHLDHRDDVKSRFVEYSNLVRSHLERRGYSLIEEVNLVDSRFCHAGLAVCDIVGYICAAAATQTRENLEQLFDASPRSQEKRAHIDRWFNQVSTIDCKMSPMEQLCTQLSLTV